MIIYVLSYTAQKWIEDLLLHYIVHNITAQQRSLKQAVTCTLYSRKQQHTTQLSHSSLYLNKTIIISIFSLILSISIYYKIIDSLSNIH